MALPKELLFQWNISLKEKYLSFDKEKRIRRMQFFERMLIPSVLILILFYLPTLFIWIFFKWPTSSLSDILKFQWVLNMIFYIVLVIIAIKIYPVIIKKRAHDFWKEWKIETYLVVGWTILMSLWNIYVSYLMMNMDMKWLMDFSFSYWVILNIINLIIFLAWLELLFRPWTSWKNEYGEQKYYKLKFLG